MRDRLHFDANAGAALLPEARAAVIAAHDTMANASSVHAEGRSARAKVEMARADVAASVGAKAENVIFTSSATEAAALALSPRLMRGSAPLAAGRLYVGATEHPCVLAGGRFPAKCVTRLPVERSGVLDLAALDRALNAHDTTFGVFYLALMLANNESGVIQPVAEAVRLVKAHGGVVFCDSAQALGRIPVDIGALGADVLALSAHKIGGPQGAGALVLADVALRPEPLLTGGGQERRLRAGTENVAAIAGFGVAARAAKAHLNEAGRLAGLRDALECGVAAVARDVRIAGAGASRLPNTTLFVAPGFAAETLVIAFDLEGIAVSAGSACSSGKVGASHVLEAMGEVSGDARSGIRVSLPVYADRDGIDRFIQAWRAIHARMSARRAA